MGITRRGFLGCVAGSLTAGLPFDGPRRIDAGPPRVWHVVREGGRWRIDLDLGH